MVSADVLADFTKLVSEDLFLLMFEWGFTDVQVGFEDE